MYQVGVLRKGAFVCRGRGSCVSSSPEGRRGVASVTDSLVSAVARDLSCLCFY